MTGTITQLEDERFYMINPNGKGRATAGEYYMPLLKRDCEYAISQTNSMAEASRYLNVNYGTFKKWAKLYGVFKANPNQKGRKKNRTADALPLIDIFAGKHPHYNRTKLKSRMIRAGIKTEECELCGYHQKNPLTNLVPLTLYNLDGNNSNLALENLQLRCYNCIYVTSDKVPRVKYTANEVHQMTKDLKVLGDVSDEDFQKMQEELLNEATANEENTNE